MNAVMKMPNRAPQIEAANLGDLLTMYQNEKSAGVKWETFRNYRLRLEWFRRFWDEYGPANNYLLTPETFRQYDRWLQTDFRSKYDRPASGDALHRASQQIRQFTEWLYSSQCIEFPISGWVIGHHPVRSEQFWPTLPQFQTLFDHLAASREVTRLRDCLGLLLMFGTGARRLEVASVKIENFDFATPITNLTVGDDHSGFAYLDVTKGDKPRYVRFCSKTGLLAKAWIRTTGRAEGLLLGFGAAGLQIVIDKASAACGLPEMSCHSGRRAFMDYWVAKKPEGLSYQALKLQCGHSLHGRADVTIDRYIHTSNPNRVKQLITQFHCSPVDDLQIDWSRWPVNIPA